MKYLTLLFFFPFISFGQTDLQEKKLFDQFTFELGFNVFSCTDSQRNIFLVTPSNFGKTKLKNYKGDFKMNYIPGFFGKIKYKKNGVRFSVDCARNEYTEAHYYGDWSKRIDGTVKLFEYRLGYEREFGNGRIKPFVSTDFCYRFSKFSGCFEGYTAVTFAASNGYSEYKDAGYAVSVGTGFKYSISQDINLIYELTFQLGVYEDGGTDKYDYYFIHFYPVRQLGISYSF